MEQPAQHQPRGTAHQGSGDTRHNETPELGVSILRRTARRTGTGRTDPVWAVDVPAGGTVRMAPGGLGVVILDPPALRAGQKVTYLLWFRQSGKVAVRASVTEGVR
ncbi:Protein of unknown function [Streptomyces sp. OV198]|uniref:copper chaperone PCu(A)C n=1 Tax=Streptomyces sp. OV198 TaxID=1882787 RepID=UPI000BDAF057|nr:copper chaperone PCu(A)C [Streptomyces sp. OV198]SOE79700.1 Protein of unknown function [Streptomyces sp. OV198]